MERPSVESLIMSFAASLTRRATCLQLQSGCVITSEDMTQIYGFGYNGTAKGIPNDCHYGEVNVFGQAPDYCTCVHSEINSLIKVRLNDPRKVLFVTAPPCLSCAKAIINSGVSRVYYRSAYVLDSGLELLQQVGVSVERV